MAYALVGTAGTGGSGGSGAAFTPSFGTGETLATDDLLIACVWANSSNTTVPSTTTTGWSRAVSIGSGLTPAIFWGIGGTAVAAPTIAAVSGITWTGFCMEFSGNATTGTSDQIAFTSGTTSPLAATNNAADSTPGELFVYVETALYTTAATKTTSTALNNGMTVNDVTNNDTNSALVHFRAGYGITTGNSAADQASFTYTTTKISLAAVVGASFKASISLVQSRTLLGVGI